ncbi:hypothetical protein TB2_042946 [Malus domestica]
MMTILSSETMNIPDGVKIKVDAKPRHPHRSLPHRKSHHRHHQGVSLQDAFVYANFSINASISNEAKSIDTRNFLKEAFKGYIIGQRTKTFTWSLMNVAGCWEPIKIDLADMEEKKEETIAAFIEEVHLSHSFGRHRGEKHDIM